MFRALAGIAALTALFAAPSAFAKQCIWNKGGYYLDVRWFKPADLGWNFAADGRRIVQATARPVREQKIALGQGSCTDTSEIRTAVVEMFGVSNICRIRFHDTWQDCNGEFDERIQPNYFTILQQGAQLAGPFTNDGTARIDYKFTEHHSQTKNDHDTWFVIMVATPPTDRYLDFWGATTTIEYGPGGPIQ